MVFSVLVVQNHLSSPSGIVGDRVLARGGRLDVRAPRYGCPLPDDASGHDAMIILGGEVAADDDVTSPFLPALCALARSFRARSAPVMGICLGSQLLARAFGGTVSRLGFTEFGYVPLAPTEAGRADPLVEAMGDTPSFMQFHEDRFTPPADAVPLLVGARCSQQAFRIDRSIYAFQPHIEATPATVREWAGLPEAGAGVAPGDDPRAIAEAQLAAHAETARVVAESVTDRWLDLIGAGG